MSHSDIGVLILSYLFYLNVGFEKTGFCCNDCCALYDDKCLDYVSMSTFIDSAERCMIITSVCI